MLNSVPSSGFYGDIGDMFLFSGTGPGGHNTGTVVAVAITAFAGLVLVAAVVYTRGGQLPSPWSGKRKNGLTPQQLTSAFTPEGKLHDRGMNILKIIRSGGIDPSIRAEVWPFLLGVYDLNSSKEERDVVSNKNRKKYQKFRRQSRQLLRQVSGKMKQKESGDTGNSKSPKDPHSSASEEVVSDQASPSSERGNTDCEYSENNSSTLVDETNSSQCSKSSTPIFNSDSSNSELSEHEQENNPDVTSEKTHSSPKKTPPFRTEDFATWQRIIRLDAIRANAEWIPHSPSMVVVSDDKARRFAEAVGLKDYDNLEPCRIYHSSRLVAILEAYTMYDPEIGYCQGMSDLLSPIISVIEEDHTAFWCFVGFMKKARHNFRLDEVGIRRQLNTVAKIIKFKDPQLYKHLVQLQAEDFFFVYRMVVVLFRRELNFEQILWLWEVMWADQAALRAGFGKSEWRTIRQRVPPTEDLLLYAIAASVLQRRKLIIEKYNSMDEIMRECNNMSGQLDVWKLLDDAHSLVMTLHGKVDSPF